jgi:Protein of unknown function (DUF2844)
MKSRLALLRGAWVYLALAVACLVVSDAAMATLGTREDQIAKVASGLNLKKVETQSSHGYSVNILSSNDLTVKEYVNPKTKLVFGVTWHGTRMPDLQLLLGFDPATLKGKGAYQPLHYSIIKTPTVTLEMGGRMGLYAGRAIRTDLLPAGAKPSEVAP